MAARPWDIKYRKEGVSHKRCRGDEAVRHTSKTSCLAEQKAAYQVKVLKCQYFAAESRKYGTSFNNKKIVTKTAGEAVEGYIYRMSSTICGKHDHGAKGLKKIAGGWGGGGQNTSGKHPSSVVILAYLVAVRSQRPRQPCGLASKVHSLRHLIDLLCVVSCQTSRSSG